MSRRAWNGAGVALLLILAGTAIPAAVDVAEHEKATAAILCDCGCHPQSVKDCACGRAAEMRGEIADLIAGKDGEGPRTADAVIALYVANHGEQILVTPPAHGFNLVAWVGPFVVLVVALAGVSLLVRRWTARSAPSAAAAGVDAPALDPADPYLGRLQRELEERR